jgi:hypothetical protein
VLTILITAGWLVVVILVVGACRVAASADGAVDELASSRRSRRRSERRLRTGLKTEAGADVADVVLLPSQPMYPSQSV